MINSLLFDESVASGIFNTTVETIAEKPSSTPQHVPVNTESIDLSIISWSETTLTRNQKKNYRKCGRNLRKNKKVCIENYYYMNIHNILTYFFFRNIWIVNQIQIMLIPTIPTRKTSGLRSATKTQKIAAMRVPVQCYLRVQLTGNTDPIILYQSPLH